MGLKHGHATVGEEVGRVSTHTRRLRRLHGPSLERPRTLESRALPTAFLAAFVSLVAVQLWLAVSGQ